MLLRTESKGIAVDTLLGSRRREIGGRIQRRRASRVVLVRLNAVEVITLTLVVRAILTVDLERLLVDRRNILRERLQMRPTCTGSRVAVGLRGRLNDPDEFLDWMIERQINTVIRRRDTLILVELGLLNEVLVRVLRHTAALLGVKIDVVDVHCSRSRLREFLDLRTRKITRNHLGIIPENINLDFVVLEGDEGECTSRIACEEEEERNVKCIGECRTTCGSIATICILNLGRSVCSLARTREKILQL